MSLTHGSTLITGRIRFCSGQLFGTPSEQKTGLSGKIPKWAEDTMALNAISRNIKDFEVFKFPGKIQDNFVKWDLFYNLSPR